MDKIVVSTVEAQRTVVVKSVDMNDQPDDREGNLDTAPGNQIVWTAPLDATVAFYTITFRVPGTKSPIWPFNGSELSLVLKPGDTKTLTVKPRVAEKVKYDVVATPIGGIAIAPCDPVIIIRPVLIPRAMFGLIWALLGAVTGAGLNMLLLKWLAGP